MLSHHVRYFSFLVYSFYLFIFSIKESFCCLISRVWYFRIRYHIDSTEMMTNNCNRNVKSQTTLTKRYFKIIVSIILMTVLILSIHLFFPWGYFLAKHHKGVPSISTSFLSGLVELSKVLARSSYRPPPLRILSGRGYLMVNSVLREVGSVCTAKLGDLRQCKENVVPAGPHDYESRFCYFTARILKMQSFVLYKYHIK